MPKPTIVNQIAREMGRRGGLARKKNLTAARRREIAQNAARARWRRVAQESSPLPDETPA